jgi:hypothetical protein
MTAHNQAVSLAINSILKLRVYDAERVHYDCEIHALAAMPLKGRVNGPYFEIIMARAFF